MAIRNASELFKNEQPAQQVNASNNIVSGPSDIALPKIVAKKPKTFFEQVKAAFPNTIKQFSKPGATNLETAASNTINRGLAPIADVAMGVGGAASKYGTMLAASDPKFRLAAKAVDFANRGSNWVNKNIFALGQRDYPLQGAAEAVNRGIAQTPVLRQIEGLPEATKIAAQSVTDPINLATAGEGVLARGAIKNAIKLAPLPEKIALGMGSRLTGISKPALLEASTEAGRAGLKKVAKESPLSGIKLSDAVNDYTRATEESEKIAKIIEKSPDIDVNELLPFFDKALINPKGPSGSLTTPANIAINKSILDYKNVARGGLLTPKQIKAMDFPGNAEAAAINVADVKSKFNMLSDVDKKAQIAAEKASSTLEKAIPKAGQTASEAGIAKREAQQLAAKAKKNVTRWGGASKQAAAEADLALEKAKVYNDRAKEAYLDAKDKLTVGSITAEDAAKIEKQYKNAQTDLHRADAAVEFSKNRDFDVASKGDLMNKVSRSLAERYPEMDVEALASAVKHGRDKVAKNSFTPNSMAPAKNTREYLVDLRRNIRYNRQKGTAHEASTGERLKIPAHDIKNLLEENVGPEYAQTMKSWSRKLGLGEELDEFIGKHEGTAQDIKAGDFIKQAASEEGNSPRRRLLRKFDKVAGTDFLNKADKLNLALEFGKEGVPGYFPKSGTGRTLSGGVPAVGATILAAAGAPVLGALGIAASPFYTSPKILVGRTIPRAKKISEGGIKLSGKLADLPLTLSNKNKAKTLAAIQANRIIQGNKPKEEE